MPRCCKCQTKTEKHRICQACQAAYNREYRRQHRPALLAKNRARYHADPEKYRKQKKESVQRHLETTRARCREWHEAHPDYWKERRNKNREHYNLQWMAWLKANPDKAKLRAERSKLNRRARESNVVSESFTRQEIFKRDKGVCQYCGELLDANNWHLDHVIPLVKGGAHLRTNVVASCPRCNLTKGTATIHPKGVSA